MGFFKSLDSIDQTIESNPIGLKISTIEYNIDSFLKNINDNSLSKVTIQNNIIYGLSSYMNYDNFQNENNKRFVQLWTNVIFLKNLLEILKNNKSILMTVKNTYITTVNKIAYDYYYEQFNLNSNLEWKKEVSDLLIEICNTVNYNYIIPMSTIMHLSTASFISMSRFSSFEQKIGIERFNNMIIGSGVSFSVKDIIYIYSLFFSEGFSSLFNVIMTSNSDNIKDSEQLHVYNNISLAVLNILNSIPSKEIYLVLKKYSLYISFFNIKSTRFSLKNLSNDFKRVNDVVEILLYDGYDII